jgi:hypothetical protein
MSTGSSVHCARYNAVAWFATAGWGVLLRAHICIDSHSQVPVKPHDFWQTHVVLLPSELSR